MNGPHPDTDPREPFGQRLVDRIRLTWVTWFLGATLCITHVLVGLVPYARGRAEWWAVLIARRGPRLLARCGAMRSRSLDRGDSMYRLVSAAFLHADGLHLLVNVLSLIVVGRVVEAIYGPVRMMWLFLLSAVSGASASWLLGHTTTSVGASGGVFGLLGALFIFGWRHREELPDDIGRIFRRRVAILVGINLALGIPLQFIDDFAHVGGLIAGAFAAMVLSHSLTPGEPQSRPNTAFLALLQLLAVGYALRRVAENWDI